MPQNFYGKLWQDKVKTQVDLNGRRGAALMALSGIGALGLRQQDVDLGPECSAGLLLVLGELGQRRRIAQAGQVGVGLPVLECLSDGLASLGRAAPRELRPRLQVGLEPGDGLLSPAGLGGGVERRVVLALA